MTPSHFPGAKSYRGHYGDPSSFRDRLAGFLLPRLGGFFLSMRQVGQSLAVKNITKQRPRLGFLKRLLNVTNALIIVWVCVLWWGERLIFSSSLAACQWQQWEQWVSDAMLRRLHYIDSASPSRQKQDHIMLC